MRRLTVVVGALAVVTAATLAIASPAIAEVTAAGAVVSTSPPDSPDFLLNATYVGGDTVPPAAVLSQSVACDGFSGILNRSHHVITAPSAGPSGTATITADYRGIIAGRGLAVVRIFDPSAGFVRIYLGLGVGFCAAGGDLDQVSILARGISIFPFETRYFTFGTDTQ